MNIDTATAVSFLGAAVTVGTVLFRTGKLSAAIDHLTAAVEKLESHRDDVDNRLNDHDRRLSVLEDRSKHPHRDGGAE